MTVVISDIDGLPQAYMELYDGSNLVRFVYKSIRRQCVSTEDAVACMHEIMRDLEANASLLTSDITIIWRTRPHIAVNKEGALTYLRFATSPPLTPAFWEKWEVKAGAEAPLWPSKE